MLHGNGRILLCFVVVVVAWPSCLLAQIYRFVDEDGVVHFSNVQNDPRYQPLGAKKKPNHNKNKKRAKKTKRRILDLYDQHIEEASRRYNIPASLIKAVITIESNFNPKAVSHAGAQGLMQLMPETAVQMGVTDVFNPRQNILGGARYLRTMANQFKGDLVLTLASYNAGQKVVKKHMDIPPIAETQRYVRRVLQVYFSFKKSETQE